MPWSWRASAWTAGPCPFPSCSSCAPPNTRRATASASARSSKTPSSATRLPCTASRTPGPKTRGRKSSSSSCCSSSSATPRCAACTRAGAAWQWRMPRKHCSSTRTT
uniref:Putative secreted protein n=1 Tax=Ixodes scapularis TaxID=6945 RepID=A0A4D5RCX4_IXOSC